MTRKVPLMEQYWEEEIEEMDMMKDDYLLEATTVKGTFYFNEHLITKYIEPVLKKKDTQDKIVEYTAKYMDRYSRQLSARGPMMQMTFNQYDRNFFYFLFNLTEEKVLEISKTMLQISGNDLSRFGLIKEGPYRIVLAGMMVYALRNNLTETITCLEYIYGFAEYPLLFKKYFRITVRKEVMLYTIEHLPNSFKLKRLNNVQELLKDDLNSATTFHAEQLKIGEDDQILKYIQRIRNQLNSKFKNLANLYYPNHEANNTIHTNSNRSDDDEIAEHETQTSIVSSNVDRVYSKFLTVGIIPAMSDVCAEKCGVDRSLLSGMLWKINDTNNNEMHRMIECILINYFAKYPSIEGILSPEFLNFGLRLYRSIGTSKDPLYMDIKRILAKWMNEIVEIRTQYSREATVIAYTRAVYDYIIWAINYHK